MPLKDFACCTLGACKIRLSDCRQSAQIVRGNAESTTYMANLALPSHFVRKVPDGDTHERDVCKTCGFVHYQNPKVVAGSVVHDAGRVLLCRRAIEPRTGFWTLPAGYMELGETTSDAARREAMEEACARIVIENVLAVYTIPRISQVQIMHVAHLAHPDVRPGPESLEVDWFDWQDIPWDELAFPSVRWALLHYDQVKDMASFPAFTSPPDEDGT